jgi:MYXO-CTERM domain-containing protein
MAREAGAARYSAWLATRRTALTWALAVCLTIVGAAQFRAGSARSVAAAGLVKTAVWNGETWRLLTGTLLHGNVLHFFFNLTALLSLGRAVEGLASRYHLAAVFLVSALSGSVFSLILLPNVPSVGASGGLLGLIGFLAVVGWRRRAVLGSAFLRSLLLSILLIALMGATAWEFIDNAAHLGGLLGGVLCGLALVDGKSSSIPLAPGRSLRWLGLASAAGCFAAAAFSVFRMV